MVYSTRAWLWVMREVENMKDIRKTRIYQQQNFFIINLKIYKIE